MLTRAVAAARSRRRNGEPGRDKEGVDVSELSAQEIWDERYRSRPAVWSGEPNRHLVSEASDLPAGSALDVGAGEGADAIWLAQQGWQVTAVDVSVVALERGAENAALVGAEVAGRISWTHADLTTWEPGHETYDLVSAQYMHLPPAQREVLFRRLSEAVAPGGSLLVVGHHPSDLETTVRRPPHAGVLYTGDDIAALLDPERWEILTNATVGRTATDPDGREVTIHDSVLRARRSTGRVGGPEDAGVAHLPA